MNKLILIFLALSLSSCATGSTFWNDVAYGLQASQAYQPVKQQVTRCVSQQYYAGGQVFTTCR